MKLIKEKSKPALCRQPARIAGLLQKGRSLLLRLSAGAACTMMTATTPLPWGGDDADAAVGAGSDIWTWLDFALKDLYDKFLSVSTIAACVAASVCLILMNFSTDDRAVATSRA